MQVNVSSYPQKAQLFDMIFIPAKYEIDSQSEKVAWRNM